MEPVSENGEMICQNCSRTWLVKKKRKNVLLNALLNVGLMGGLQSDGAGASQVSSLLLDNRWVTFSPSYPK